MGASKKRILALKRRIMLCLKICAGIRCFLQVLVGIGIT
jgi:hypothetical protein